jgi:hypothetical protein
MVEIKHTLSGGSFDLLDSGRSASDFRFVKCSRTDSDHFEGVLGRGLDLQNSITGIDWSRKCISARFERDDIGDLSGISLNPDRCGTAVSAWGVY